MALKRALARRKRLKRAGAKPHLGKHRPFRQIDTQHQMIAFLHSQGGFNLVLGVTAVIALGFVIGTAGVAILVNGVERDIKAPQPAE